MTQGIVSIRVDGIMLYKVVVGHDGMHAPKVAEAVTNLGRIPTLKELSHICDECNFGCSDCLIIMEHNPDDWSKPIAHMGPEITAEGELDDRYYATFRVAQFNPRWKYGTADYVVIIDLKGKDNAEAES